MMERPMEEKVHKLEIEVATLHSQLNELRIRLAVKDEREKQVDQKLSEIKKDVDGLKSAVNRVMWAVLLAILAAFMNFVFRGGLSIPGGP